MAKPPEHNSAFPPVRACIFDLDGTLIDSEDVYTVIYNSILREYGRPNMPWSVKARIQSRGREGAVYFLTWAQLPLTCEEWNAKVAAQRDLFRKCQPLPGVAELLDNISAGTIPPIHLAIASSSSNAAFNTKTSHLPSLTYKFPLENRVFGDDPAMSDDKKKPDPYMFLLALGRINENLREEEEKVKPEECLVFEDSVAGVEAGRRAGMRVCWVPHEGLRGVWKGKEDEVLEGRTGEVPTAGEGGQGGERSRIWSRDGRAEMLMSLEDFRYADYGIQIKKLE